MDFQVPISEVQNEKGQEKSIISWTRTKNVQKTFQGQPWLHRTLWQSGWSENTHWKRNISAQSERYSVFILTLWKAECGLWLLCFAHHIGSSHGSPPNREAEIPDRCRPDCLLSISPTCNCSICFPEFSGSSVIDEMSDCVLFSGYSHKVYSSDLTWRNDVCQPETFTFIGWREHLTSVSEWLLIWWHLENNVKRSLKLSATFWISPSSSNTRLVFSLSLFISVSFSDAQISNLYLLEHSEVGGGGGKHNA